LRPSKRSTLLCSCGAGFALQSSFGPLAGAQGEHVEEFAKVFLTVAVVFRGATVGIAGPLRWPAITSGSGRLSSLARRAAPERPTKMSRGLSEERPSGSRPSGPVGHRGKGSKKNLRVVRRSGLHGDEASKKKTCPRSTPSGALPTSAGFAQRVCCAGPGLRRWIQRGTSPNNSLMQTSGNVGRGSPNSDIFGLKARRRGACPEQPRAWKPRPAVKDT
jgi:hypothetical protein